jgi:hypothetical protein
MLRTNGETTNEVGVEKAASPDYATLSNLNYAHCGAST